MKKFFKWTITIVLVLGLSAGGVFIYHGYENAKVFDDAKPLSELVAEVQSSENYVPYDQISPILLNATVAVEDARFYEHGGIDPIGLVRAFFSQVIPFMNKSGGSTISQQTVKNLYQQFNQGITWKISEIFLADKLEQMLSKNDILALYVNIINYGDDYIGINEASMGYFGVMPADLTAAQATILAGIPQSPSYYQLSDHFDNARVKQKTVLDAMVRHEYISQEFADEIYAQPIYPQAFYQVYPQTVLPWALRIQCI